MAELPDITVYLEALQSRIAGRVLEKADGAGSFLLRTERTPQECIGHLVREVRRIGKRIAIGFDGALWMVLHPLPAGRLHWSTKSRRPTAAAPSPLSPSTSAASR